MNTSARRSAQEKAQKGAVQSKTKIGDRWRSYQAHHRSSMMDSYKRLLATPLQTLMTSLVVAIALALPMTLLLVLENVKQLGASWDTNPKVSVYLKVRARPEAVDLLLDRLRAYPEIAVVEYLSPQEALEDFQRFSGFADVLQSLDSNPLPPTVILTPQSSYMLPHQLQALGDKILEEGIVDSVSLDMDWVRRLQEIMLLGKKIVLALAALLALGVLLAVGNTIRLAIENRREEILVVKLVGGTNGFVRRPFLYSGGWYGLFGGMLACVIVGFGYATIEPAVLRLAALYESTFVLQGLDWRLALKLLLFSTVLGWVGAWVAVGRHLSEIEPS